MADDEKVILITGASTGIGAATARLAVQAGYRVVLSARSADKLEALASDLGGDDRALAVPADVGVWEDNERLAKAALDRYGRIDVVFANAGFGAERSFLGDTPEHWREMVLTNVLGVAYTIRATLEAVRARQGHLILTSSAARRRGIEGSLYSATNRAAPAMGESLRQERNGSGARVTLIEPGMVDTPFFDTPGEGRLEAEDVAEVVMFAVSRPARVDVNEILVRPTAQDG